MNCQSLFSREKNQNVLHKKFTQHAKCYFFRMITLTRVSFIYSRNVWINNSFGWTAAPFFNSFIKYENIFSNIT